MRSENGATQTALIGLSPANRPNRRHEVGRLSQWPPAALERAPFGARPPFAIFNCNSYIIGRYVGKAEIQEASNRPFEGEVGRHSADPTKPTP